MPVQKLVYVFVSSSLTCQDGTALYSLASQPRQMTTPVSGESPPRDIGLPPRPASFDFYPDPPIQSRHIVSAPIWEVGAIGELHLVISSFVEAKSSIH